MVAIAKLSHVVAGSAEAAYAVLTGTASVGQYFWGFLAPTLLGNIVGGVALVALLNHGAVAKEINEGEVEGSEG